MRSSPWKTLTGIVLIALGALFMIGQVGYVEPDNIVQRAWPLAIVLYGILHWLASPARFVTPAIIAAIGLVLLSTTLQLISASTLAFFWPLALVAVGAWILFNRASFARRSASDPDNVDSFVICGNVETLSRSQSFRGGSAVTMFGEIKLDLREAQPTSDFATLDATAIFGAVFIRVPRDWKVEVSGAPILGKITNPAVAESSPSQGTAVLKVDALAIFGEVKIER